MGRIRQIRDNGKILLACMGIEEAKRLDPKLSIYFFSPLRKLLFKSKLSKNYNEQFLMSPPEEIKIEDTR